MHILLTIVAVGVGMLIAIQPALNARLAGTLGSPFFGALTNFGVGLGVVAVAGLLIFRPAIPRTEQLAAAPWWAWCGGLLGATFVTLSILLMPRLGAVLFIGSNPRRPAPRRIDHRPLWPDRHQAAPADALAHRRSRPSDHRAHRRADRHAPVDDRPNRACAHAMIRPA